MGSRLVKLMDRNGRVLATAQVVDEGTHFGGTIDLGQTPKEVRALFDEFQEIVDGQMFSFLDEVQGKIDALSIRAEFDSGDEVEVRNLQVFPSTGDASFELVRNTANLNGQVQGRGAKV